MNTSLDIIIPCLNSKETLTNTLNSIKKQKDVKGFNVYLINDNSKYNYEEEVNYFSKYFYIKEITLKKNMGPGYSRQIGISKSKSKYIMFIDSDDILYKEHAIYNLYNAIGDNDLCISNFILERDNVKVIKKKNLVWLHGKIYKRQFLIDNNIKFNNSYANEDNGFNRLIIFLRPKAVFLDKITYIYKENPNSLTRENNRSYKIFGLKGFIYNMKWAIDEALKRNVDDSFVPSFATSVLVNMYYDYLWCINENNSDNIIRYSKDILPYYLKYKKISKEKLKEFFKAKEEDLKSENKKFKKVISFNQFIRKVIEIN